MNGLEERLLCVLAMRDCTCASSAATEEEDHVNNHVLLNAAVQAGRRSAEWTT